MIVDIKKIVVGDRIRKDFGDIEELAEDIKQNGLINPPVVNKDYELLAGERRLKACKSLGWNQIEIRMMDTRDAEHELNVEISENDVRKGFSKAERVDYMKRLLRIEEAKAKKRKQEGVRLKSDEGRADDKTASQFNIGRDTMRKELSIVDNKELLSLKDFEDWDEGKLSTNKAYKKIKAKLQESAQRIEELEARQPEVREVVKQVVPEDYEELKENLNFAKFNAQRVENDYQKVREENAAQRQRIRELEDQLGTGKAKYEANVAINHFTDATNNYLQMYGGHVWAFSEIENVDEATRIPFIKAIKSLDGFAQQLLKNIGGLNG